MIFSPSGKALFSPQVVGRANELGVLLAAFNEVAVPDGKPRTVFIAGEAGLGKSRLCRALTEELNKHDLTLLFGQATLQDQALSFGPFQEALRRYFQNMARLQPELSPGLQPLIPYLIRLLPELRELFPEIPAVLPTTSVEAASVQEQNRLFNAVLELFRQIAQTQPLVLMLEDLHWADETSLQLLSYLVRDLSAANLLSDSNAPRILIVATYRSEELAESSALGRITRQLTRQRMAEELRLRACFKRVK